MRYPALLFLALLTSVTGLSGQTGGEEENNAGELSLRIKSITFFKDNEYFNNIGHYDFAMVSALPAFADKGEWIEGYTLTGFFLHPELIYTASKKVSLRAGVHMLRYSGKDKFSQFRPLFSATVSLSEKTSLTVGSLNGSNSHKLFDPHFNFEKLYNAYSEDGFQITRTGDHFFNDTWINWENFVFKGDSEREILTFGESLRYLTDPFAGFLRLEVPLQLQFKHFGGQVSDFPESVETYLNFASGLRLTADIANKKLGVAGIEFNKFFNSASNATPPLSISSGDASWYKFDYNYNSLRLAVSYWKAHDFYAPNGNEIYASTIDPHIKYIVHDREIITGTFNYSLLPESYIELFLGFDSYYDVCLKRADYAISLHLDFDRLIGLSENKRKKK